MTVLKAFTLTIVGAGVPIAVIVGLALSTTFDKIAVMTLLIGGAAAYAGWVFWVIHDELREKKESQADRIERLERELGIK